MVSICNAGLQDSKMRIPQCVTPTCSSVLFVEEVKKTIQEQSFIKWLHGEIALLFAPIRPSGRVVCNVCFKLD